MAALTVVAALVLRRNWTQVRAAGGLPEALPVLVAVGANVVGNLLLAENWHGLVRRAGARVRRREALWVHAVSQVSRYGVGGANVAVRAVMAQRHGLSAAAGAGLVLVEALWQVGVLAAAALVTLPAWLPAAGDLTWLAWAAVVPTAVCLAVVAVPTGTVHALARALGAVPLRQAAVLARRAAAFRGTRELTLRMTWLYLLGVVVRTAGFVVLARAVTDVDPAVAVGAFAAGNLSGRLAVVVPAGLGARDAVIALVLTPSVGLGPAALIAAVARLVDVVAELAVLGVAQLGAGRAAPPPG